MSITKTSINRGFLIFLATICLLTFIFETVNGRFWLTDFRVYYSAARNFFSGQEVYNVCFDGGSGYYKYSPVILFFFLPLCYLGYKAASVIYFFILGFIFWYTFSLILKILKRYFFPFTKKEGLLISLSFVCILIYFVREMHVGNINIILLMLSCLTLRNYVENNPARGSLFLGLILLAKPFYLILLLVLLLRKQWKPLAWLGFVLLCGILLPVVIRGFFGMVDLYAGWFRTVISHSRDFPGMGTLDYIVRINFFRDIPGSFEYIILFLMCGLISVFILTNQKKEKMLNSGDVMTKRNFLFEGFLLVAILPVLFRNDWVQFLCSAPLIAFMIFYIPASKRYWMIFPLFVLLFFFSANSDDLLGKERTDLILKSGIMGLSNILLIITSCLLFLDFRRRNAVHK